MAQTINSTARLLNSWKEIAAYLDRGTRTVQRWERDLHLPVHRIGRGKRSPVYCTSAELNFWLSTSEADRPQELPPMQPARIHGSNNPYLQNLRELRQKMRDLSQTVAESSVRQRRQAELAKQRMIELRSHIKAS